MKKISLICSMVAICSLSAWAGGGTEDGKGGGDFYGQITAVEVTRDSFTVKNADGIVKMFSISPDKKPQLAVGQRVTVSFTDQYTWPLPTKRIALEKQQ